MPKRTGKRKLEVLKQAAAIESDSEENSENDEESEHSSNDESISEEEVDLEFDGSSPNENDFHGILNLLHQLFVTLRLSASSLVDKIIEQSHIGSTLKITNNEENEVYGLTTAVTIEKGLPFFKLLTDALLSKMKLTNESKAEIFNNKLNAKKTMFMMNERFINVPIQLAVPLLTALRSDVESESKTTKKKKTNESGKETQKALFDGVEQILVICKTLQKVDNLDEAYNDTDTLQKIKQKKKNKKKKKKSNNDTLTSKLEFVNAEEELFLKASSFHFSYSVVEATGLASGQTWEHDDQPMKTYRTVLLMPIGCLKTLVNDVEEFIGP